MYTLDLQTAPTPAQIAALKNQPEDAQLEYIANLQHTDFCARLRQAGYEPRKAEDNQAVIDEMRRTQAIRISHGFDETGPYEPRNIEIYQRANPDNGTPDYIFLFDAKKPRFVAEVKFVSRMWQPPSPPAFARGVVSYAEVYIGDLYGMNFDIGLSNATNNNEVFIEALQHRRPTPPAPASASAAARPLETKPRWGWPLNKIFG